MQRPWFYVLVWTACRIWYAIYNRLSVRGARNLPSEGPVLVCANHASNLDPTLVAICFAHRLFRFMAKAELFSVPILGTAIRWLGAFPVDREAKGGDRSSYVESLKSLKEGGVLLVFPEGTRTEDGNVQEFLAGASRLACSVPGTRILPVRIRGTFESFGRGRSFPLPSKIVVTVGEPFRPDEIKGLPGDKHAWYQAVTQETRRRILDL